MTNKKPKITVIIRAYNSEKFICKAVDSALKQTLDKKLYEILVIDDGSQDNTLNILKKYGQKIRIVRQNHLGPAQASSKGISKSNGQYITLLDADDQFLPDILKKMLLEFEKDKFIDFVYCDYFEKLGKKIKKVSLKNNIFKSLACGIMFKKKILKKFRFHDQRLIFGEYDLLIRLIKNKKIGRHIPLPLYTYVRTKGSLTFDSDRVKRGIKQLRVKYGDIVDKIRSY